jgi:hypothetical protein
MRTWREERHASEPQNEEERDFQAGAHPNVLRPPVHVQDSLEISKKVQAAIPFQEETGTRHR